MLKITKYVLYDIVRSRVTVAYTAFLLLVSLSLFHLEENPAKAVMSLTTVVLAAVPLVSLVFATIHYYNSYEFIELMLTQPLSRRRVLLSEYAGTGASLLAAFGVGVGLPVALYHPTATGGALVGVGALLTGVFTSVAFLGAVLARDKARGIGVALLLWFYFALIYDGLVLLVLFTFSDYPLEQLTLVLSSLNPIDLGRIFLMLQLDISALMGYTGATYKDFFGSPLGGVYTAAILALWVVLPLGGALRCFNRKDI